MLGPTRRWGSVVGERRWRRDPPFGGARASPVGDGSGRDGPQTWGMIRSLVVKKMSRWRRVAVLALPAVLAGSGVGATQAVAQPAAHAGPVRGTAAATAILDGFRHPRIVAFGLAHGLRQQEDFAIGLL